MLDKGTCIVIYTEALQAMCRENQKKIPHSSKPVHNRRLTREDGRRHVPQDQAVPGSKQESVLNKPSKAIDSAAGGVSTTRSLLPTPLNKKIPEKTKASWPKRHR
jgi:hypothetical protein